MRAGAGSGTTTMRRAGSGESVVGDTTVTRCTGRERGMGWAVCSRRMILPTVHRACTDDTTSAATLTSITSPHRAYILR